MKVALVHDYLTHLGGAERVLASFRTLWPDAPIYTLLYNSTECDGVFGDADVRTSFLQRIPFATRYHRVLPLLMPLAIEQFDLSSYDLVVSSSASFAKGALTDVGTKHVCYCHTPMRYAWGGSHSLTRSFRSFRLARPFLPVGLNYLRMWDSHSATRPDAYLANSRAVQSRIAKYYRRDAVVVHPPVLTERFTRDPVDGGRDGIVMLGRLLPYKGFDIGIRAAAIASVRLTILGDGPERRRLERLAQRLGADVQFAGRCTDAEVVDHLYNASALLFPGIEDFGIVPLEAMLAGCPVVARAAGGALETVRDGETGILVHDSSPASFATALQRVSEMSFDRSALRTYAMQFSEERFRTEVHDAIMAELG